MPRSLTGLGYSRGRRRNGYWGAVCGALLGAGRNLRTRSGDYGLILGDLHVAGRSHSPVQGTESFVWQYNNQRRVCHKIDKNHDAPTTNPLYPYKFVRFPFFGLNSARFCNTIKVSSIRRVRDAVWQGYSARKMHPERYECRQRDGLAGCGASCTAACFVNQKRRRALWGFLIVS